MACTWFLATIIVVMTPAFWNGFPLLYPDTGGYLARPFEGDLALGRSALYGVFLAAGIPAFFWINIAVQAALVVWLISLLLRGFGLGGRPGLLLAIVASLTVASAMAWFAATLMPDIWLPASVLALYLLAFQTRMLARAERIALVATVAFAIASHMGTLAVCLALAAGLCVLRVLPRTPFRHFPRPKLVLATAAVGAGLLLAPLSNLVIAGQFKFTPGGDSFLFGRLVQDGIVARYLNDRCPDPAIRLCLYREKMPTMADDWLWAPGNVLSEMGGWENFARQERRIVIETVRMYPVMHVTEAVRTTAEQLLMMRTDIAVVPEWMEPAIGALRELVPRITPAMMAARQQNAPFPQTIEAFNRLHVPVAAFSALALIALLVLARRQVVPPEVTALAAVVLLAILINAAVCGTFSNPVHRYESRLIWLAPLTVILAGLTFRRERRAA